MHLARTVWRNRSLFVQLCERDVVERYRGSAGGLLWSFVTPLVMLGIYTFVFGVVFNAHWGRREVSRLDYALLLFAGLLVFGVFSECATRAATLVTSRPNFVKKVVFPLELLPAVALANAMFHFAIGFVLLLGFCLFAYGAIPGTILLLPIVLLPLVLLSLAVGWLLSSMGVFLHDLRHAVPLVTSALMFVTPVFYPTTAVPERFRTLMWINPLTVPVESLRDVAIFGQAPDWVGLGVSIALNAAAAALSFLWFQRARRFFADVL